MFLNDILVRHLFGELQKFRCTSNLLSAHSELSKSHRSIVDPKLDIRIFCNRSLLLVILQVEGESIL